LKICKKRLYERFKNNRVWFHLLGIACTIWFLLRSGTAPHRTRYPCQQFSLAVATAYIGFWVLIFQGFFILMRKAKRKTMRVIPAFLVVLLLLYSFGGGVLSYKLLSVRQTSKNWKPICKDPIGVPKGINPGRVVWVWNPDATRSELKGFWWLEENNNQSILDKMFSQGLKNLTGKHTDFEAWDTLFRFFNKEHDYGDMGYQLGEKIAIKINLNNCFGYPKGWYEYVKEDNERDANPFVVKSLLRQLVYVVGVPQEDIIVFDASRPIPNWFYDRVADEFPNVHYVDYRGGAPGREKVQPSSEKIYFTDGTIRTLPTCVVEAKYFINMPLLKKHPINNGVTLSGKNLFGTFIEPVVDLHPYHISGQTMGNPAPQVDLLAHKHLGGKTLLYIGDGTYGTLFDHRTIVKFHMYPFNDDWTNSLFFSQDPVAIDSVMYDFLYAEAPPPTEGSQNYLHQAAEPPKNIYDPERDGVFLSESLGVHEHWDTSVDIFSPNRYSGASNNGIDFVAIGKKYAKPSIVITKPREHMCYVNGKEKSFKITWKYIYTIPITLIVGNITVEAQVNDAEDNIDYVEFYLDGKLQYVDEKPPYKWEWNKPSFSRHMLKVVASINNKYFLEAKRIVWKIF